MPPTPRRRTGNFVKQWVETHVKRLIGPFGVLLVPAAVAFVLLFLLPFSWLGALSFEEFEPGVNNYVALFTSAGGTRVFASTFYFALWSTIVSLLGAYVLAYVICYGQSLHRALLVVLVYSLWVSALIRALAWLILLTDRGIVNETLRQLGLVTAPVRMAHSDFGVIIGMVHFLLPITTLSLVASFRGIDRACMLAARGLGAGPVNAFVRVFLPLSTPAVVGATALTLVLALGFYIVPTLLGGGRRTVMAEFISLEVLDHGNWGMPSAAAIVLAVLTIAIVVIGSRLTLTQRHART